MSTPIFAQLSSARRAIRQQALRYGLRRALSAGICAVVVALFLGHRWPITAPWIYVLFLVGVCGYALQPWWQVRTLLRNDTQLARWIESQLPGFRNDLSAVLEFQTRTSPTATAEALRARLRARVEAQIASITSWGAVLPLSGERVERRIALGLSVVALLLVLTPSVRQHLWQRDASSEAEANQEAQDLPEAMVLRSLDVHLQPPAYTGLPDRTLEHISGEIRVQEGTQVRVSGQTYPTIENAWIAHDDEEREATQLRVQDGHFFEGVFIATADETLQFGVEDGRDKVLDERKLTVRVDTDDPPEITLKDPVDDVHVTPGEALEFHYEVSDDFGLRDVHLVWHFKGQEEDAQRILLLDDASGTFAEDTAPFDTAPLYMQPGDEVVVYIEARDNVSFRPPNVGESRAITLYVEEEEDLSEDLLARKEELYEAVLKQLGSLLPIALYEVEPDGDDGFQLTPTSHADEAVNAENLQQLANALSEDGAAVHAALEQTLHVLEAMDDGDEREQKLFVSMSSGFESSYTAISKHLARWEAEMEAQQVPAQGAEDVTPPFLELTQDMERAALLLASLISEHKAQDVARALEELSEIRSRLRDLLEEYKETNNPETRARIERELARLSRRMNDLMQKLADQVENLPQEHFNAEGLEPGDVQEQVSTMQDAMQNLRDAMASSDADAAMNAFEQLSQNLDALYQEMGDPTLDADEDTLSEFDRAMGEVNDDISALESMQRAVEEETDKMHQELQEEAIERNKDALEALLERAKKDVRAAKKRVAESSPDATDASLQQALKDAEQRLQQLDAHLEKQEFSVAEDAALDAMDALQKIRDESRKERRYTTEDDARKALREMEKSSAKDAGVMRDLAKEFRALQERLTPQAGDDRSAQLESLAERQKEAQQGLEQLQQKFDEIGEKFPTMKPDEDGGEFQRAEEGMRQSQDALQDGASGSAHQGQKQALDSLHDMRQGLQQRMAKHRQQLKQQAEQEGRGGGKQEKVDVSKENERDLRQRDQIMDAMREGRLEAWEDPIRQYYDSLVR